MNTLLLNRRTLVASSALLYVFGAHAEPLNPGRFRPFVDGNRVDVEIAHVLNVLGSYPPGSWSREASDFAFEQLRSGALLALARTSTAAMKVGPQLLPRFPLAAPELARVIANVASGVFTAYTAHLGTAGSMASYTVFSDPPVLSGTQPGPDREFLAMILVHELHHARNREQLTFMQSDPTPSAALFVDATLAAAQAGQAAMADFAAELAASHVTWRCLKEWDNRWRGSPIPRGVDTRALYQFAIEQAEHNRVSSPYLQTLATRAPTLAGVDDFNRQVALWMRTMRSLMFVRSAAENAQVGNLFDAAAAQAASLGFRRPAEAPDGALNYWSKIR
jgi:hypothetical protein